MSLPCPCLHPKTRFLTLISNSTSMSTWYIRHAQEQVDLFLMISSLAPFFLFTLFCYYFPCCSHLVCFPDLPGGKFYCPSLNQSINPSHLPFFLNQWRKLFCFSDYGMLWPCATWSSLNGQAGRFLPRNFIIHTVLDKERNMG